MAFYRCMGGNGGGTTPTSITPSNSSPAAMTSGGVYQPTANGYAIASYDSKTPSDSTPPSVASGDIVKMGGAGYLYETQQIDLLSPDVQYDNASASTSGTADIAVTQKPRLIIMAVWSRGNTYAGQLGIYDVENNVAKRKGYWSSSAVSWSDWSNVANFFPTITDTKVTYNIAAWGGAHRVYINIYY